MGGIKLYFHPLFFVFGFYYAVTGKIFVFFLYCFSAVIHELGHSLVAQAFGYRLNKITLMPFGAVVSGETDYQRRKEEIVIALAGPMVNLFVGIFFVAVWWVFPEAYAVTDVAAEVNLSLAIVNLLPFLPLDGGRIVKALLSGSVGAKKAEKTCKVAGVTFATTLFALFIASVFYTINFSLILFASFVFFGAIKKDKENVYAKIFLTTSERRLKRGMQYKKQGVDKNMTVKKLVGILDENAINEVVVFDKDTEIARLSQKRIAEIVQKADFNAPIAKYIGNNA